MLLISQSVNTESPISKIPYDVLQEIFVHCLPQHPLHNKVSQPKNTVAPMLLCRVSSFWRMVALTSASLWSELSFCLRVTHIGGESEEWAILKADLEFIQWWKQNQGTIAPILSINPSATPKYINQPHLWARDGMDFVANYINTAQYLAIHSFIYWLQHQKWINAGNQTRYPNLHTLVVCGSDHPTFHDIKLLVGAESNIAPSPLRRLHLHQDHKTARNPLTIHWTTLTDISFPSVPVSLDFWYSLIRSVPHLRWGTFFVVREFSHTPSESASPTIYIHPQLTTLFIKFLDEDNEFPFDLPFTSLHIPALRTLSLSLSLPILSYIYPWQEQTRLITILLSTPNITTLILGQGFLSYFQISNSTSQDILSAPDLAPIWDQAIHIAHLQLELPATLNTLQNIFFPGNRWLDMDNPACPIRAITIIDSWLEKVREEATSYIRELADKIPNIDFQVVAQSPARAAGCAWEDWGA